MINETKGQNHDLFGLYFFYHCFFYLFCWAMFVFGESGFMVKTSFFLVKTGFFGEKGFLGDNILSVKTCFLVKTSFL